MVVVKGEENEIEQRRLCGGLRLVEDFGGVVVREL